MPTYKQAQFITRAIESLKLQTFANWELIIVNDGSPDSTREIITPFLEDSRIRYYENPTNKGLGFCLNRAIGYSSYDLIAYLPSDDIYYQDHLCTLYEVLQNDPLAVLTYSKLDLKGDEKKTLQLVQLLHRKTPDLWIERSELVSDDYNRLFLHKLAGKVVEAKHKTCEWTEHPEQMSKIINEKFGGGLYRYKLFYNVFEPLLFQSSYGNLINEKELYKGFQAKIGRSSEDRPLKILIVGELAFNPERIYALEERGHKLYGLWMRKPIFFNTIGPLPFGNVENIPYENWRAKVQEIKPDIIYALLNCQAITFAHEILMHTREIPFVWHFKEEPFYSIKTGTWKELFELYSLCDGRIFINEPCRDWFAQVLPHQDTPTFILDGDLPKRDWFSGERSPLLSERDGEIHTVLPGRAIGLFPMDIKTVIKQKIHLHFYGELYHNPVINDIRSVLSRWRRRYLHLHPHCDQTSWLKEFSQYDAGWLHIFDSRNQGELMQANWNDLNYPARIATFGAVGLPMLHKDNSGHLAAMDSLTKKLDIGIPFRSFKELGKIFKNKARMKAVRDNAWNNRKFFYFDHFADDLVVFFEKVIKYKRKMNNAKKHLAGLCLVLFLVGVDGFEPPTLCL